MIHFEPLCLIPIIGIIVPMALLVALAWKKEDVPFSTVLIAPLIFVLSAVLTYFIAIETGFVPAHAGVEPAIFLGLFIVGPILTFIIVGIVVAYYLRHRTTSQDTTSTRY